MNQYVPQSWFDGPSGGTPIEAARINVIEQGIADASAKAYAAYNALPPQGDNLTALVTTFVAPFTAAMSYREPTGPELTSALSGLQQLLGDSVAAAATLSGLGFTVTAGVDSVSKRPYILAYSGTDNRGWGLYLFDLSTPINLVVECPHPVSDQNSELMGLAHWQARPGCLLMIAGAHRDAASALADVAHQTNNPFHGMAAAYATKKVAQIQWHGFADETAPGLTQVVSPGTGVVTTAVKRVGLELANAGFSVGQAWDSSGSGTSLTATTNVQGIDAAAKGSTWVHVENNASVRSDPVTRGKAVKAVLAAEIDTMAFADGSGPLAQAVTGQFPKSLGSANTVGTTPYTARADHIHKDPRHFPVPGDFGYKVWSSDPASAVATCSPTTGLLYLQRITLRDPDTITNLHCGVTATGTMTSGQNFLAIFDSSGNRIGVTADITSLLAATGEVKAALTAALSNLAAGSYYLGVLLNGSPMITLARGGATVGGIGNANMTTSTRRQASYGSAQTAVPATLTLTSLANTAHAPWLAAS